MADMSLQKVAAAATRLPPPRASREGEGGLVRSPVCNDANYGSYITTQQPGPEAQEPRLGGGEQSERKAGRLQGTARAPYVDPISPLSPS